MNECVRDRSRFGVVGLLVVDADVQSRTENRYQLDVGKPRRRHTHDKIMIFLSFSHSMTCPESRNRDRSNH